MTRLLIYASAVDCHKPADWYQYRDRVREILDSASVASVTRVDDDPLFSYGADVGSVIARVNGTRPRSGEIVLAQWSTIVFYSASVLFLGDDVDARAVRAALVGEPFLKEHAGSYSLDSGSCFAYELYPYAEADADVIAATRHLVDCVPDRVYVGAAWVINDGEGVPDETRFEVLRRLRSETHAWRQEAVVFRPRVEGVEREIWAAEAQGEGLLVMREDDPRLPATPEALDSSNELSLFVGGADDGRAFPRVTIGRCHMDDTFVCLYNHPRVTDANLRFLV